ncbi:MAG: RsmD family RNA methyltransferase [Candidatus Shikimatogenerans sp. Tduv]|uniref:RsmD family RNA methyltransferase n=1 Tax=Candidatus Shikimatogenerans sp. Tduv TaxID=3158567 RepID=A0AAU7QRG6_9FLAO
MKILSGKFKNKNIYFKKNKFIRPVTSYNKKRIFNKLKIYKNSEILDLFCGSGNISFEFISNDCKVLAIDNYKEAINIIKYNIKKLKINNNTITYKHIDVIKFLKNNKKKFNIIFIDPPYKYTIIKINIIINYIYKYKFLKKKGIIILSNLYKNKFFFIKKPFYVIKSKKNSFFFFKY